MPSHFFLSLQNIIFPRCAAIFLSLLTRSRDFPLWTAKRPRWQASSSWWNIQQMREKRAGLMGTIMFWFRIVRIFTRFRVHKLAAKSRGAFFSSSTRDYWAIKALFYIFNKATSFSAGPRRSHKYELWSPIGCYFGRRGDNNWIKQFLCFMEKQTNTSGKFFTFFTRKSLESRWRQQYFNLPYLITHKLMEIRKLN